MLNINNSPVRKVKGKAELFSSSATSITGEILQIKDFNIKKPKAESNVAVRCLGKNLFNYKTADWTESPILRGDQLIFVDSYKPHVDFYAEEHGWLKRGQRYIFSQELLQAYSNDGESMFEGLPMSIEIYYTDGTSQRATKNIAIERNHVAITTDANKDIEYMRIIPVENEVEAVLSGLMLSTWNDVSYEEYKTPIESVNNKIALYYPYSTVYADEDKVINLTYNNPDVYVKDFTYRDNLKSFTIDRVADGTKFFGYGICQKINVKLVDKDREIMTTTNNSFRAYLTTGDEYVSNFPTFNITENHRDENTNELSITAYDGLYRLSESFISEIDINPPYTLKELTERICEFMGCSLITNVESSFNLSFPEGANLEGTETLREVLDSIAEATQTIYFLDSDNNLVFKRFDRDGAPVLTIGKSDYITLDSKDNRRLSKIVSATELGDDLYASLLAAGTTQYIRDNPFWDLREDRAQLVEEALEAIGGLTINQFECEWRGNYFLSLGDKLDIITKDNKRITTYLLDEVLEYNGFLSSKLRWSYDSNESETPANPTTLGESLKQTFARVDKANKQIDLVVSDVNELSQIQMTTNNIVASVSDEVDNLTQKVEASMTKEDVKILIQEMSDFEVNEITTTTGFTFNADGLTVSKSGSEMTTQITEDGMRINKGSEEVLKVDNVGVKAEDLHAITYLIIGKNSRFEDYEDNRTGCFWIGAWR